MSTETQFMDFLTRWSLIAVKQCDWYSWNLIWEYMIMIMFCLHVGKIKALDI